MARHLNSLGVWTNLHDFPKTEESGLQLSRGPLLHPWHDVAVSIQSHPGRRTLEVFLHNLWVPALLEQQRRVAVPEVGRLAYIREFIERLRG